MADLFDNIQVMGVEDLTLSLKRVVEGSFSRVRVRGELRGVVVHRQSGHMYGSVREGKAVLDVVCWRERRSCLKWEPEEGMEVIVTGKLTVYGGRSRYQLAIESMELAGEGAILKMLSDRRERLEKEGLFSEERKKRIPLWSEVVGVVSSPSSAAMHDIVKTAGLRMGIHIVVWPSLMQGEGASREVVAGLEGFNGLERGGEVPRPDVIIVARGGGSVEDLLPFSDEVLLRAVARSEIPVVSAIGHESDHCLLDEVADVRVATPTAAAARVVPLRSMLEGRLLMASERMRVCVRGVYERGEREGGERGRRLARVGCEGVRYEERWKRVVRDLEVVVGRVRARGERRWLLLGEMSPYENVRRKEGMWQEKCWRFRGVSEGGEERRIYHVREVGRHFLRVKPDVGMGEARLMRGGEALRGGVRGILERGEAMWRGGSRLLESLDVRSVLRRGFVVVRGRGGGVVRDGEGAKKEGFLRLQFLEEEVGVRVEEGGEGG